MTKLSDQELARIAARTRLRGYINYVSPSAAHAWNSKHIRKLVNKLEAVERGEIKRLIITMPPRHFKSQTATAHFSPWYLGRNPDKRVIGTSYGASLVSGFSRQARELTEQYGPEIFGITVNPRSASTEKWDVMRIDEKDPTKLRPARGGMAAVGVGGSLTGKGAHCLPAGTRIQTENGPIDISELFNMENPPLVYSFNHLTGDIELKPIVAARKVVSDGIFEIRTVSGNTVFATGEHQFFTNQHGYRTAELLRAGDKFICYSRKENLRPLRRNVIEKCADMQGVLRGTSKNDCRIVLSYVRKTFRTPAIRVPKGCFEKRTNLLFCAVCSGLPKKKMSSMRETSTKEVQQVLFSGVSETGVSNSRTTGEKMSGMRQHISATIQENTVLFQGMCRQGSFSTHDRLRKFQIQRWNELREMVSGDETFNFRERCSLLRSVRNKRRVFERYVAGKNRDQIKSYNPSHKQRSAVEYTGESNFNLSGLPHETSQIETDSVSLVRELRTGEIYVYDIQVDGNNNFFANEILVHNCLIIDDPHKDREEAESQVMRDKVWNWYTSTAYTRLESDGAIIVIQTRWHKDDLAGRLLKAMDTDDEYAESWEVVDFPALAETEDDLGRKPGDALWPEGGFDAKRLRQIRVAIGTKDFLSLYQQKPQDNEGGAFKAHWFKWYTSSDVEYREQEDRWYFRNEPLTIFAGVDLATSEKSQADDFACVIIGVTPTMKVVVMDVLSGHFDPGDQAGLISEQYLNWLPERVVIEDNGGQKYLVTEVKRWHNTHKGHPLIPVKAVTNTGEKYQRIIRMAPFVENGGLYLRMARDEEPGFRDQDREHVRDIRIHRKMEKLYYQLVELTPAIEHEDVADALDMAVSVGAKNGRFLDDWANSILNDTTS